MLRVLRRRSLLAEALRSDPSQPQDHADWLRAARSIDHLHASCPRPGWLVYCAYFADLPQDLLLEGALAVGRHAARIDRRAPFGPDLLDRLPDLTYPDVRATIRTCLASAPGAEEWCDVVPTQTNPDLAIDLDVLDDMDDEDSPERDRGPYRAEGSDPRDRARAAAHAMTIEAFVHRQRGLREALTARSAASAALFSVAFESIEPGFPETALSMLRVAYGWPAPT